MEPKKHEGKIELTDIIVHEHVEEAKCCVFDIAVNDMMTDAEKLHALTFIAGLAAMAMADVRAHIDPYDEFEKYDDVILRYTVEVNSAYMAIRDTSYAERINNPAFKAMLEFND